MKITVETTVAALIEEVWAAWNNPEDTQQWNAASMTVIPQQLGLTCARGEHSLRA